MTTNAERRPAGNGPANNKATADADTILAQTLANADGWWLDCSGRGVTWWAEAGVPFTAEDVRDLGVPEPDHCARWGALFAAFRARGIIECIGYKVATRPSRHGGILRVWVGVPDRVSQVVATPLSKVTVGRVDLGGLTPLSAVRTGVSADADAV